MRDHIFHRDIIRATNLQQYKSPSLNDIDAVYAYDDHF